jgi:hypothetical protein
MRDCVMSDNYIQTDGESAVGVYWFNPTHTVGNFVRNVITGNNLVNIDRPTGPTGTPWALGPTEDNWLGFSVGFQFTGDLDMNGDNMPAESGVKNCTITNNQVHGFRLGFLMLQSTRVMLTGNIHYRTAGQKPPTVGLGFVFSDVAETNNRSIHVAGGGIDQSTLTPSSIASTGARVWIGDGSLNVHAWPYNLELEII